VPSGLVTGSIDPSTTGTDPTTSSTSTTGALPPVGGLPVGGQQEAPKAPVLTLAGLTGNLKAGVFSVGFNATEPGTTTGLLYIPTKTAKNLKAAKAKRVLLGSGKTTTTTAGPAKLAIKLKKKYRKALKHRSKLKATLELKTVSGAGLASPLVTKKVTLKGKK
jgi:hypothetical protein